MLLNSFFMSWPKEFLLFSVNLPVAIAGGHITYRYKYLLTTILTLTMTPTMTPTMTLTMTLTMTPTMTAHYDTNNDLNYKSKLTSTMTPNHDLHQNTNQTPTSMGVAAFITEISTPEQRTFRLATISFVSSLGGPLGTKVTFLVWRIV